MFDRSNETTNRPTDQTNGRTGGVVVLLACCGFHIITPAWSGLIYPLAVVLVRALLRTTHAHTHTHTHTQNQSINQLIHTPPTNIGRTQGVGSTTVMITSTSMINDLVGEHESAKGGFVFGAYSLTDKYVGRGCVRISRK